MDELEPQGSTVQRVVIAVPNGQVATWRLKGLVVLALRGQLSPALLREFESLVKSTAASIGLDLGGLNGVRPSLVTAMERVRRLLERRGHALVLLNPPQQVMELLSLLGVVEKYRVDGRRGNASARSVESAAKLESFRVQLRQSEELERGIENAEHRISSFMPQSLPSSPGWSFAAYWRPCDRIGGDFYDFIPLGRTKVGIALGDVSGHGLAGAVVMGMAKKVLRLRAQDLAYQTPADVLAQVNADLLGELTGGTFVTMLYGVLDYQSGAFVFARAGHEPPLFLPGAPAMPEFVASAGIAIGVVPPKAFRSVVQSCHVQIGPGQGVLLLSDGIADAVDRRDVRFAKGRICEAFRGDRAPIAMRRLLTALDDYTEGAPQNDDITAVAFSRD